MAHLSPFHIRISLNGPQGARPGKFRFGYAESPAKQRRDRDVRDTAHNPNELGRICILLAGVCGRGLVGFRVRAKPLDATRPLDLRSGPSARAKKKSMATFAKPRQ